MLLNFVNAFLIQTSHTALSNGTATIEERLARWLLMAQDRLDGDEVPLTHEFLSLMLGVRRVGVTGALNQLARKGVIRLSRGRIWIVDREGLIDFCQRQLWHPRSDDPAEFTGAVTSVFKTHSRTFKL